jgi:hypothetical protein
MNIFEKIKEFDYYFWKWCLGKSIDEIIDKCENGFWLIWLAKELGIDAKSFVLAKSGCTKVYEAYLEDKRSLDAIEVSEAFGLGNATIKELEIAYHHAKYACNLHIINADKLNSTRANTLAVYLAMECLDVNSIFSIAKTYSINTIPFIKYEQKMSNVCRKVFGDTLKELFQYRLNFEGIYLEVIKQAHGKVE